MSIKLSVCIPVWNQERLVLNALDHIPRRDDVEVLAPESLRLKIAEKIERLARKYKNEEKLQR